MLGGTFGAYATALLGIPLPWIKTRQVYALLGLVNKWSPERVNASSTSATTPSSWDPSASARRSSPPPWATSPSAAGSASTSNAATGSFKRLRTSRLDNSHDVEIRKLLRVDLLIIDDRMLSATTPALNSPLIPVELGCPHVPLVGAGSGGSGDVLVEVRLVIDVVLCSTARFSHGPLIGLDDIGVDVTVGLHPDEQAASVGRGDAEVGAVVVTVPGDLEAVVALDPCPPSPSRTR